MPTCQACGLAHDAATCPRCSKIDALFPPLAPLPPPLAIPGPPSPLSNTLAQSRPGPDEAQEGLLRYAAQRGDEIAMPPLSALPVAEDMECPRCAERIKIRAKMCRFCGLDFLAPNQQRSSGRFRAASPVAQPVQQINHYHAATRPAASPGVAAVLSFFVVGLGQIYSGRVLKGFAFMFWAIVVGVVAVLFEEKGEHNGAVLFGWGMGLLCWGVSIVDAFVGADEIGASTEDLVPSKRKRFRR